MSLINDALKRARHAQHRAPAPTDAGPDLRPVEAGQEAPVATWLAAKAGVVVVALLALALLWHWTHRASPVTRVSAAPRKPVVGVVTARETKPAGISTREVRTPAKRGEVQGAPSAPAAGKESVASDATNAALHSVVSAAATPPPPVVPVSAPPAQPPAPANRAPALKLQGIVLNPKRPSVLINGQTLFVGEWFGDWEVAAIGQESATLVSGGQTNVLTLER